MPRILLTSTNAARRNYYGDKAFAELRGLGAVRINDTDTPLSPAEMIRLGEGCDIIVSDRQTSGPAEVFDALPDLAAFVRVAMDVRNIDIAAASRNGILVTRASAGFMAAVSELVIGAMIAMARGVVDAALAYRAGRDCEITMGRQLSGASLGVIGFGAVGRHLAGLARALGMTVRVSDPFVESVPTGIESVDLDTLLGSSDFVVCLAAANRTTENLMNADAFAKMRKGAFFLNPSRGGLVDEEALIAALDSGRLAGASVDVGRAADEMPSARLARHAKIVATPHIGGLTPESIQHQSLETVRQCAAILRGEAPMGALNAAEATRLHAFESVNPTRG